MVPVVMAPFPVRETWPVAVEVRAMLARQLTLQMRRQMRVPPETVGTA